MTKIPGINLYLQVLIAFLAIVGTIISQPIIVHAEAISCAEPKPPKVDDNNDSNDENSKPSPPLSDRNDPKRQVTVRFEIKSDKNEKGEQGFRQGTGVIISKRSLENGKFRYTVLTVDHNFVSSAWNFFNILEPQYPPLPHLNSDPNNLPELEKLPEKWKKNPRVELFTCDEKIYEVKARNLIRLRRNFRALDNKTVIKDPGLDLALVEFDSEIVIEPANLAAPLANIISSEIGVNGWAAQGEGYDKGIVRINNVPDYLGNRGRNGNELSYEAGKKGMSGGPVFDSNGIVVGIHTSEEGADPEIRIPSNLSNGCTTQFQAQVPLASGIPINTLMNQLQGLPSSEGINPDIFFALPSKLKEPQAISTRPNQQSAPSNAEKSYNRGIFLMATDPGKYNEIKQAFDDSIKEKPNYPEAYYARGFANFCRQLPSAATYNPKEALQDFQQAAKIPNSPVRMNSLIASAGVLAVQKNYKLAKEVLENLTKEEEYKSQPRPYINLGLICAQQFDDECRNKYWEEAKKKLKDDPESNFQDSLWLARLMESYNHSDKEELWGIVLAGAKNYELITEFVRVLRRYYNSEKNAIKLINQLAEKNEDLVKDDRTLPDKNIRDTAIAVVQGFKGSWGGGENKGIVPVEVSNILRSPIKRERIAQLLIKFREKYPDNPNVFMSRAYFNYSQGKGKVPETIEDFKEALKLYRDTYKDEMNAKRVENQLCRIPEYTNSPEAQGICSPHQPITKPPGTPDPPITTAIDPRITETFYCDPTSGRLTINRTENGDRSLIRWESNRFTPWGYDPQLRCQQVSARLREYRASGDLKDLNRITYGRMNNLNVLCVARLERILERSTTRCNGGLLILTLEPQQNPGQVLREFKQVLTGTYPNPPLLKELSNPASKQ